MTAQSFAIVLVRAFGLWLILAGILAFLERSTKRNCMLPKSPKCRVVLKVVASLIFLLSGLDSHVVAQTVTEGEAGKVPEIGVLTIKWDNAGRVKIDAKMCLMEDVIRVGAAIARKKIRIESLPDAALSLDFNGEYYDVDVLFHAIVTGQDVEVTKEGNIYVIRKKKSKPSPRAEQKGSRPQKESGK